MSDRRAEISRRSFLKGIGAFTASVALGSVIDSTYNNVATAQCLPIAPIIEECPKSVGFTINGTQIIRTSHQGKEVSSIENPAGPVGVDLRLSLRQAPIETAMWGTFKPTQEGAALIQMGPIKDAIEPSRLPLSLYGPRFEISGCFEYDGEALVEECGQEVLRPGWVVNVERIIKEGGVRKFMPEFSFTISPDCGDAKREYIDTVTKAVVVPPSGPARKPVIPPVTTTEGTGRPGRQPAQLPRSGDGSTEIPNPNPTIPRSPGH